MVSVSCVYNIVSRYTSVNLCFSLCVYQYVCLCLSMHVSVGSCTEYVMCVYSRVYTAGFKRASKRA